MARRRILKLLYPTACAACLAVGYALAGKWLALALAVIVWLAWRLAGGRMPSVVLAVSVAAAAAGSGLGASPFLMLPAATLALASWDAVRWDAFLAGELPAEVEARLERLHSANLALALGPALLVATAGRLIHFQILFGVLAVLALLALLGLDRLWRLLRD